MEEMLGNIAGARQVFERWMEWQPEEQAWHSYINFELRYKEVERARTIYERYILWTSSEWCHCFSGCSLSIEISWSVLVAINITLKVRKISFISFSFIGT
jgi:hypothetical protein